MSRCRTCHVDILDPSMVCPLCHTVLENERQEGDPVEQRRWMYPNVRNVARKLNFVVKLYIFLAIVLEAGLIVINYLTYTGLWWSAISGVAILYFYMTLRYSIQKNSGYKRVILMQTFGGVFLTICIDVIIGYRGWSLDFVVPSAILLLDLAVIILMLVNMENWQSYILLQMMNVLFGILILIFWRMGLIRWPMLAVIAASVSVVLFIGTLIFGDRRAKNELKRRFHV